MNYNQLATQAHENAVRHGFWEQKLSNEHCLCLILTEVCEAVECDRVNKHADFDEYVKMPNKQICYYYLPQRYRRYNLDSNRNWKLHYP